MADVAILLPVLKRPHRIEPLLKSIAEGSADVDHVAIFAASDEPTVSELERLGARYVVDGGDTYPNRINRLFNETTAPYVFLGADDLAFHPGWFHAAMRVMEQVNGVVAVCDMYNRAGTHFLVSREYVMDPGAVADAPGAVLHGGYLHAYCDDELRETAKARGRFAYANDAIVEHLHWGAGKAPQDDVYRLGEATMMQGLRTFQSRSHLWA